MTTRITVIFISWSIGLTELAKASGCADLAGCRSIVQAAAEEQRSLIYSVLDSKLVDETVFLKGVSRWLEIPWWSEPIIGVSGPLREKVPAKTALRYHVVPLQEDEDGISIAFYDPFDLLARQALASSLHQRIVYVMSTRTQIVKRIFFYDLSREPLQYLIGSHFTFHL